MEQFIYEVKLKVTVDAFDESDAWDAIQEAFGVGHTGAVEVTDCEYREQHNKKK